MYHVNINANDKGIIMKEKKDITSFDAILDAKHGRVGTAEREQFRKEALKWMNMMVKEEEYYKN